MGALPEGDGDSAITKEGMLMFEFWNKMKDWQKGGLIGFFLSALAAIYVIYDWYSLSKLTGQSFLSYFNIEGVEILFTIIIFPTVYFLTMGKLFSTFNCREDKKNYMKWVLSGILIGILFFFIMFMVIINIAKPY
jgi:hypothetical protein